MSLELDALRRELAVKAKCGIDFLLAAWLYNSYRQHRSAYQPVA